MARPRKGNQRRQDAEPGGLWHQPALMNLIADLLIVASTAALVWAALAALQRLPVFPLRELVLTAAPQRVSAVQLEDAARSAVAGNFFTVDLDAARAAFEKLPWVRKAAVRRQWPDGIALTLEEQEALARWRKPDGSGREEDFVNRYGEVFVAERPQNAPLLPLFSGPDGSAPELLQRHAAFDAALASIGRRVAALTLSPRHAWHLQLDDGVTVELGRDQDDHSLAERLGRFVAYYDQIQTRAGKVRAVDMRYPNGFVISGPASGSATQRPAGQGRKT